MIWCSEDDIRPKKARRKRRSQPEVNSEEEEVGPEEARRLALLRLGGKLRKPGGTALGRSALREEPGEAAPPRGDSVRFKCKCGHVEQVPILSYEVFYCCVPEKPPALVHQVSTEEHLEQRISACPHCGANRHPSYIIESDGPESALPKRQWLMK